MGLTRRSRSGLLTAVVTVQVILARSLRRSVTRLPQEANATQWAASRRTSALVLLFPGPSPLRPCASSAWTLRDRPAGSARSRGGCRRCPGALAAARASWVRQKAQASRSLSLPGSKTRMASSQRLDHLRMHHGVERAVQQHPGAQPGQGPEAIGRHRAAPQRLSRASPRASLCLTSSRSRLAAAAPHFGQFVGLRLDTALPLAGSKIGRARSNRAYWSWAFSPPATRRHMIQ